MSEKVSTDVLRRVYAANGDGAYIEVKPSPDDPEELLVMSTRSEISKWWFGEMPEFGMTPEFARALAAALIAAADELEPRHD